MPSIDTWWIERRWGALENCHLLRKDSFLLGFCMEWTVLYICLNCQQVVPKSRYNHPPNPFSSVLFAYGLYLIFCWFFALFFLWVMFTCVLICLLLLRMGSCPCFYLQGFSSSQEYVLVWSNKEAWILWSKKGVERKLGDQRPHMFETPKTRGVSHCGLAIYIKKYLKAKEELWKLKYFTIQKSNLQKIH